MFRWIFLSGICIMSLFGINLKSFFDYTFDSNKQYDMIEAKKLYFQKKCNTCHGEQGQKRIANSRILQEMSARELKAALIDYTLNSKNSASAVQMALYAKNLSHNDMDTIIAYLKGKDFALETEAQDFEEPLKKTKNGTFLK
ncbi:c-type cytochrome [Campylobacter sp. MIT 21-1685]|uniref:c-type cytochrome n=1 Tax=unclassified Campylobacter TaxID=2593542 RepID=UPI00224AE2D7|nr:MULTISPECIES: c-type cytochrome [unclassified Campylobacter]MCX2682311.1 c-type cytochrome [Campylobacter sp. MIT 21-1684]MCX2750591.1 c-type cytochrome [Campylobacter sp. MIT 21-1682]MCX2806862.1 c-type cytochrome [Campylobacter sp. MIT 21-1685]